MWGGVRVGLEHQVLQDQSKNQSRRFTVVIRKVAQFISDMDVIILETEEMASTPINLSAILGLSVVFIPFYNEGWAGLALGALYVAFFFFLIFYYPFAPVL